MTSLQTLVIASLSSAIVGGLAAGLVVSMTSPTPPRERRPVGEPQAEPPPESGELTRLEVRLAALEGKLAALRRQQQSREQLKKYAESLAEDDGTGASKKRAPNGVVDGEDPVFELAVRSVMDRVDWEKDEQQKAERQQQRDERADRQTALLTERLGLNDEQSEAVSAVLVRQMDRFRALRDRDGNSEGPRPATRSEWRQQITEIRKQTEDELLAVLTEAQMAEYRAVAEEEGIGARGFGRRGRERDANRREPAEGTNVQEAAE